MTSTQLQTRVRETSYLSKFGYVVRKDVLQQTDLYQLTSELRARPLRDDKYTFGCPKDDSFPVYLETKNKLYIPKMFGIERFGLPSKWLPSYDGKRWASPLSFVGTLFDHQRVPVTTLHDALISRGGGVLQLGTGMGKSIIAIKVMTMLQTKAIVVVNKIPLLNQWKAEIEMFLPGARVGVIQGQKKVDVEGKHIVLAMLQSLARIDYPAELFEDFGCVVIDEIHNTSSRVFSKVLSKLCCQYTVGLSATPKRSDGCEYVFKWHIGDIVYQSTGERRGRVPHVHTVRLASKQYREVATTHRFTGQKQIQFTTMLTELTQMNARNRLLVQLIKSYQAEGRTVLVLSDRRSHLQTIKMALDADTGIAFTYGLFLGQMKQRDLEVSKACDVILATYQAFGEGVSKRELDTLILTTPKKYIGHLNGAKLNESGRLEQIVGRIFRKEHVERHPVIVDLFDNFSVYKAQYAQRKAFYSSHFANLQMMTYDVDLDTTSPEFNMVLKRKDVVGEVEPCSHTNFDECMIE